MSINTKALSWLFCGITIIIIGNYIYSNHVMDSSRLHEIQALRYFVEPNKRPETNLKPDMMLSEHAYDRLIQGLPINPLVPCPESIGANYTCQKNYKADWEGRSDTGDVLEERMQRLRSRCQKYYSHLWNASLSEYGSNHSVMEQNFNDFRIPKMMMFNSIENVAMCMMPKMGTVFIKRAWGELLKAPMTNESLHRERLNIKRRAGREHFKYFWGNQTKLPLNERFVTYTIGRSPWTRAVSVFREKCERLLSPKPYRCILNFGLGCSGNKYHVEFPDFVRCLVKRMREERTEFFGHVQTTYSRCGICDYPHNYVVVLENYMEETAYIFKEAGLADPLPVLNRVRNETMRPVEIEGKKLSYSDYWKQVPSDLIDRFRFLYRYEIMLFDYPESPFIIP